MLARLVRTACLLALAVVLASSPAMAQQVIQDFGDALTNYQYDSPTHVQGGLPTTGNRATGVDGNNQSGFPAPGALVGNPFGDVWSGLRYLNGVDVARGTYNQVEVDIALPSGGPRWRIARAYEGLQEDGSGHFDSSGPQGNNWFQLSQPEIVLAEHATDDAKDVLYLHHGNRFFEYRRQNATSDEFRGVNGAAGVFQYSGPSGSEPGTFTLTDQNGSQMVFFFNEDENDTNADPAHGQLWKKIDPVGNSAYVGHATSGSSAVTNGYDSSGAIETAYESGGRRFIFSYNGDNRLASVVAEDYISPNWEEAGKVEYEYYVDADSHGGDGDLKLVTITTPLTDANVDLVQKKYFRYWEGTFNATTNPGHDHAIKYIYDYEGVRRFDWTGDSTFDEDFLGATDSALESYASAYFEYDSAHRIVKAWFNGECGCSGGVDGTYEFEYEGNSSYTDNPSIYQSIWATRTIVKHPDGSYLTQYFDEVQQPLHQVVSDGDPDSASDFWVTKVTRNSTGQVTEVSTPANVTGYTHSSASFTTSTSSGLVWAYDRETSGNMKGFLTKRKHAKGTSGTAYLDEKLTYTSESQTIGDVTMIRPLIACRIVYPSDETTSESAGDLIETSYGYNEYTSHPLALETATTTYPAVTTSNNGSGSSTTAQVHYSEDGLIDFEKSTDGIITYREYTDGQLTKVIEDADTSKTGSGEDFENVTIPTSPVSFSSSGTPLHRVTKYSYDTQGRLDETTLPGGRITKEYYSKLADGRLVTLSYPGYVSTPAFYGPVQYTVRNQAGKTEVQAVVGLSGNTTSTALTGHIDETYSDPILAANLGSVESMTTFIYGSTGSRLDEQRLYHLVPASGAGSDGTNYDATLYGYDDSGHRWRVKEPTGTIRRMVYDLHGRITERWMGTDDSNFDGGEGSSPDMVKTEALVYDGGVDGGNGLLTSRTLYVEDGTTDQRVTQYEYDLRGRRRLEKRPTAPHTLTDYDNLGRVTATAQYSSYSSIDISMHDAATEATNRLDLSKNNYDELGRVWKSTWHKILQADGSDDDNLESLSWFDAEGRVIKTDGSTLAKTTYDRLGRMTHEFILASDDDEQYDYADVIDVSGDVVVEERQKAYDVDGQVIMRATIERLHDDWGAGATDEALDKNEDGDALKYTALDLMGRIQITAYWYDEDTRRHVDTVRFGTYNGNDFNRAGFVDDEPPARSSTALRTTYSYHDSGRLKTVEDPRGNFTYYEYDDAGRTTKEVRNYDASVNSGNPSGTDDNVTVLYVYTNGLLTSMTADMPSGTDDQVTKYIYGTTDGTPSASKVSTEHLLRATVYPDSSNSGATEGDINQANGDLDVVSYAYNAQEEIVFTKDQGENTLAYSYDLAGRPTAIGISAESDFNGDVATVETVYDDLGRKSTVTQYDGQTTPVVLDQVKYTYNDWGALSAFQEDRNSTISGDAFEVSYSYAKAAGGRNALRLTDMTLPSGNVIHLEYVSTSGRVDDDLSRVTRLKDGTTTIVEYDYLGESSLVGTEYVQVDAMSNLFNSSGAYDCLDRFNRITTNRWTKDLFQDRDFYNISLAYDEGSNITSIEDNVHSGFDVEYSIDALGRITRAEEGTWNGSSIVNRSRDQQWTLDQVGNWDVAKLDLDGDGDFTDDEAGEYNDDRTHNKVNELNARDTDDDGTDDLTLTYDENGNLTNDGENYTYEYDPLGRLCVVRKISDSSIVAEYRYNGLGHRIGAHYDTDRSGGVTGSDYWFYYAYDAEWRLLAVYADRSSDPDFVEEYIHHLAGLDGGGGASYIDDLVLRDRDAGTDGIFDERLYYCQNWRADVSVIIDDQGEMVEWVKYSAYGVPFGLPAGDTDSDGDCDLSDSGQIQIWLNNVPVSYDVRGDLDLNGAITTGDKSEAEGGYTSLGLTRLSGVGNLCGFGGYWKDSVLEDVYLVRHRLYNSCLGRWHTRDLAEYVDGESLYAFGVSAPLRWADSTGLFVECVGLPCQEVSDPVFANTGKKKKDKKGKDTEEDETQEDLIKEKLSKLKTTGKTRDRAGCEKAALDEIKDQLKNQVPAVKCGSPCICVFKQQTRTEEVKVIASKNRPIKVECKPVYSKIRTATASSPFLSVSGVFKATVVIKEGTCALPDKEDSKGLQVSPIRMER